MFGNNASGNKDISIGSLIKSKTCSCTLGIDFKEKKKEKEKACAEPMMAFGRTFAKPAERPSTSGLRDRFRKR